MNATEVPTTSFQAGALTATRRGENVVVQDHSCGNCATCQSGSRLWCTQPGDAYDLFSPITRLDPRDLLRSLTASAAFLSARVDPQSVVLVLDHASDDPMSIESVLRRVHPGAVFGTSNASDKDIRARIAEASASGRADAVVASHLARDAVKAVVRGGIVCLPADAVESPTVTELVQREVRLVGARNVHEILERVA